MLQMAVITHSFTIFNYITKYVYRSDVTSYTKTKPRPKHSKIPYTPGLASEWTNRLLTEPSPTKHSPTLKNSVLQETNLRYQ